MKRRSQQPLRFLTDENFSTRLVRLLHVFVDHTVTIEPLIAHFPAGTDDETWLSAIGSWTPKPVVIGGDGRILTHPARLVALRSARLHFVVFAGGFMGLPWQQQAIRTLEVWESICDAVSKA